MVATRNHPQDFDAPATEPTPKPSPSKRSTRSSTANVSATNGATSKAPEPPEQPTVVRRTPASSGPSRQSARWSHTPSNLTLIWLAVGLPLVIWDTGYVLFRPHTMPGGSLHWPLYTPYKWYGEVDGAYGFKAIRENNGWTGAQGLVNSFETSAYLVYLYLVYAYGQQEDTQGRGAPDRDTLGTLRALAESRTLYGKEATWAVLIAYSTALVTFIKTVLYWLIEVFNGFDNIKQNSWAEIIFPWIIMNGLWLVFPLYMVYVFGAEILQGLEFAAEGDKKVL